LDIDLTPHCERRFDPSEQKEIARLQTESLKRIASAILGAPKLQHLTMTAKFFRGFEHLDVATTIRFFSRIMSADSLKVIQFDGLPCNFENSDANREASGVDVQHVNKVGLSSNLEKVVLRLRCQSRVQYAHSVRWFLMQLKAHLTLEVVVIEPYTDHILPFHNQMEDEQDWRKQHNVKHNIAMLKQFFAMDKGDWDQKNIYQPDHIDKDCLSLSTHLLKANGAHLTCW
jgi:hypothetical protein